MEPPSGKRIKLTFEEFQVEYEGNCGYDSVRIQYGDFDEKLCGELQNLQWENFISGYRQSITITFLTDYSVTGKGFSAVWEAID